jgi:hypothetical protein
MNAQAEQMKHMVQGLVTLVEGQRGKSAAAPVKRKPAAAKRRVHKTAAPAASSKNMAPEKLIPFDDNDGDAFQDF